MELNFKVFGAGPPLVICHGLFGMLDNWQTLAKRWANDFTVYIVDQRNHGKSPHSDAFSYPLLAEDLVAFMESQWIFQAYLLGHSMGGKTVMQTALDYPDKVDKLVVVDMGPEANPPGHEDIFEAMLSLPVDIAQSRKDAEAHLAQYIGQSGTRQFLMKNLSRADNGGFRWKMNLKALHDSYSEILAAMPEAVYDDPTLFVRGDLSNYLPVQADEAIHSRFTASTIASIPKAGHWVHADQPDLLYQTVLDFLLD